MKRKGFDINLKSQVIIASNVNLNSNIINKIFIALKVLKFLLAYISLKSKQKINKT